MVDDTGLKDACILMLAERLYICSRLLTCAAERLGWDSAYVNDLMWQMEEATDKDVRDARSEKSE